MNSTVKLTPDQMVGFLMTIGTSSMFISAKSATPFKLNQKDKQGNPNPFGTVTKQANITGWLNIDYQAAVERRIAKVTGIPVTRVSYDLGEVWFRHLLTDDGKKTPVVVNKTKEDGKFYVFYFHRKTKSAKYLGSNGEPITYDQLTPWLPAPRKDTPNKPAVRALTINNLQELRARGMILRGA